MVGSSIPYILEVLCNSFISSGVGLGIWWSLSSLVSSTVIHAPVTGSYVNTGGGLGCTSLFVYFLEAYLFSMISVLFQNIMFISPISERSRGFGVLGPLGARAPTQPRAAGRCSEAAGI